jgi:glyoxylase-like metal-dependent hydrolase (beta-lactamase superfamily II)
MRALGGAGALLTGLGALPGAPRVHAAKAPLEVTELGAGLFLIAGAGGNVVLRADPAGGLMVDSGSAERAEDLRAAVAGVLGDAPLRALLNTHWHVDHTGGNDALAGPDLVIAAHENTRLWMSTEFYVEWEERRYERRAAEALPNKTFFSSDPQPLEIAVGDAKAAYAHLPEAHTDGDIYVRFPDRNVIVAGGVMTSGRYPILDYITGGWIGGMVDATQKLIEMSDASTLIVPDVGPPQRRADLEAHVQMLSTVRERIEAIALQGRGVQDMIAEEITKEFDERYGSDSELFISNAYEGMWWNRLRGIVA